LFTLTRTSHMITVEEAGRIIQAELRDYGAEIMPFELTLGRVLAENIKADRDLPPFNRVTMDGIAVNYESVKNGICSFHIQATQAAGDAPIEVGEADHCIEIMTGASLPASLDTIIRYEDLEIRAGIASIIINCHEVKQGQNIHFKGRDKKQYDVVAELGQLITPAIISIVASIGETEIRVKKMPRVVIISSGDELVEVNQTPLLYQIRKSNNYTIKAVLQQHNIDAAMLHIPDDPEITRNKIQQCLQNYDAILLSGGISMGKFDYIPQALEELQVKQLFHKVKQRPGKPFWFGSHANGAVVFAFPGNPVAAFMCLHRFFLPWLQATLGLKAQSYIYAILDSDINFQPELEYFLQVKLQVNNQGQLMASPIEGNGSGDFANLADTNAFMQLPLEKNEFKKGEIYKVLVF
jgi:molybdopterin molybdotransferase